MLAFLLAELSKYYPSFGVDVVDDCIERIRIDLELNLFKRNQKRISMIKYLGELYNYHMVDSNLIFETLYFVIRFGHENKVPIAGIYCPIDRPDDFFRTRLVCTLLDTVNFKRMRGLKKLDLFLIFFQVEINPDCRCISLQKIHCRWI
jgi:regulator of nonsense transcripts 2